jgi:hypothetical protein
MRPGSASPFRPRELEMQLRILPPVLTFSFSSHEPNPRAHSLPLHFHSARCSRSLTHSGNSESRNQRNMKRDICASHKTRLIIFVCQTRGDQMSHLYSCRERESAAAAIYTSLSLSLVRCVRAGARADDDDAQRATASKQCPVQRSLYCRRRFCSQRNAFSRARAKREKTSKDPPKRAAWILSLEKQASKWRSAVYARRISLLTGSSVCF